MNVCDSCIEHEVPECAETLIFDFSFTAGEYIVIFENHFGTKHRFNVETGYSTSIWIETADLPAGYFFRDNTYEVKFYESQSAYQCDSPIELCTEGKTCLTLRVKQIETDQLDILIECC